ncbi:MAG TPA: FliH/SctL family protein [Polyangiaceae bacterium]|jgi:flagellar assembly protein FliH
MADAPRKVSFARVNNPRVRAPSWMPSARGRAGVKKEEPLPSLKPPPLPSEFVDAIRQELELEPERGSRPPRASELPPRLPSMPAPAPATAIATEPGPVQLVVDPEATHAFEQAVELLVAERSRVLEQTASQLGELATIIARRVIAHEISLNPNIVAGLVSEGLAALGAHDRVLVRIGSAFREARANLEQRLADRGAHAEVRLDESLSEYGCLVETELGRVDESIESRISTLLQALRPESDAPSDDSR